MRREFFEAVSYRVSNFMLLPSPMSKSTGILAPIRWTAQNNFNKATLSPNISNTRSSDSSCTAFLQSSTDVVGGRCAYSGSDAPARAGSSGTSGGRRRLHAQWQSRELKRGWRLQVDHKYTDTHVSMVHALSNMICGICTLFSEVKRCVMPQVCDRRCHV